MSKEDKTKLNNIESGATKVTETTVSGWGFKKTDTDTKNTAGSTNSNSLLFLIGASSQAANPVTYSNNQIYAISDTLYTSNLAVRGAIESDHYYSDRQTQTQ